LANISRSYEENKTVPFFHSQRKSNQSAT